MGARERRRTGCAAETCALARFPALIDFPHVKNLLLTLCLGAVLLSPACARADAAWINDLKKAQDEAKANHKLVLVDFTGSDWCGFCFQLDRAILSKPEFKDYASKNLILLEIDFPRRKALPVEIKKQNAQLAEKFQVEGFPTLVVLNGDGKAVWRYDGLYTGGVAAFLAELDKIRKG
jgi:protein disulfide-isomerase